jgi:thioredoxin-like negative regulator of GroEL
MKKTSRLLVTALLLAASAVPLHAETTEVSDGGQTIELSDVLNRGEAGILVFYAPWHTESVSLKEEMESWADQYNLTVVLVDVVDERTQVYQQFDLDDLPAMLIFDKDHDQVGGELDSVSDLEEALRDAELI